MRQSWRHMYRSKIIEGYSYTPPPLSRLINVTQIDWHEEALGYYFARPPSEFSRYQRVERDTRGTKLSLIKVRTTHDDSWSVCIHFQGWREWEWEKSSKTEVAKHAAVSLSPSLPTNSGRYSNSDLRNSTSYYSRELLTRCAINQRELREARVFPPHSKTSIDVDRSWRTGEKVWRSRADPIILVINQGLPYSSNAPSLVNIGADR